MTQRYEEVSNCRLFKTILYLHCRAAACALPTVLGVTACFCCKKFCLFLEVFLLLQPEKRILMTNRFHAQLTRLLLPLPDKSVKLTSFSPEGLQMCGVCLNTHTHTQLLPYYNTGVCTGACSGYARAVAAEERRLSSLPQPLFCVLPRLFNYFKYYLTMQQEKQDLMNGAAYEAPKCETIEVQNEGVLCQSASNESFTEKPWGGSWD